jgi:hypothetical protein
MGNGTEEQILKKEADTLNLAERAEVGSAVGAAILALTYVSGYLTATTYLGTFSIPADTSELFRAKYIYIGFEYWLFVAIFGVCFYAANLFARLFKAEEVDLDGMRKERENVANELVKRGMNLDTFLQKARLLRWGGVMALISVVFSFEILFMETAEFRDYLPLQALFLLFLSLYQTTFYREYSKESYGWGVLWGINMVRFIRWVYSIFLGSICTLLMLGKALYSHLDGLWFIKIFYGLVWIFNSSWHLWFWMWFITLITFLVALFVTLGSEHLKWTDKRTPGRGEVLLFIIAPVFIPIAVFHAFMEFVRLAWNKAFKSGAVMGESVSWLRLFFRLVDSVLVPLCAAVYCWMACNVWAGKSGRPLVIICGYCTLIFALVVLTNILVLSRKHQQREKDLEVAEKFKKAQEEQNPGATIKPNREEGWVIAMRLVVPVAVLYLVSVLGFAHLIYPFIPVDKAGGDYSTDSPALIGLNNESAECKSAKLSSTIQPDAKFYVIEETPDWLYLARADSGLGPDCWKWGIFCDDALRGPVTATGRVASGAIGGTSREQRPFFRPEVHQVNRRCIASVDSAP